LPFALLSVIKTLDGKINKKDFKIIRKAGKTMIERIIFKKGRKIKKPQNYNKTETKNKRI
jgi:hypothetical protein